MKRAIKKLKVKPNLVLVDGNKSPDLNNYITKTVIKGDQKIKENICSINCCKSIKR